MNRFVKASQGRRLPLGRPAAVRLLPASGSLTTVFSYCLLRNVERVTRGVVVGAVLVVVVAALVTRSPEVAV